MAPPSELLNAALEYADRGWPIFPLTPNSKKPTQDSNGVNDATCDRTIITRWWTEMPNANIGFALGHGNVAIDVDNKDGRSGSATWLAICEAHPEIPNTRVHSTPNEGFHYIFTPMDGTEYRNLGDKDLGSGIELRAEGYYIVLPPSKINGKAWKVYQDTPCAKLPPFFMKYINERKERDRGIEKEGPYVAATVKNIVDEVRTATPGRRNNTLAGAALTLGQLLNIGGLTWSLAEWALIDAARLNGFDDSFTEEEVRATIRSGLNAGLEKQRVVKGADQQYIWSLKEMVDAERSAEPPLIAGLYDGNVIIVYGRPGGYKTTLLQHQMAHVSEGLTWMGLETTQMSVVQFDRENRWQDIIGHYLAIVRGSAALQAVAVDGLPGNIFQVPVVPLHYLDSKEFITWVVSVVREKVPTGPVVTTWDCMGDFYGSLDENSPSDMMRAIGRLREVAEQLRGPAIALTHPGKNQTSEKMLPRGASSLEGHADATVKMYLAGDSKRIIRVTQVKARYGKIHEYAYIPYWEENGEVLRIESTEALPGPKMLSHKEGLLRKTEVQSILQYLEGKELVRRAELLRDLAIEGLVNESTGRRLVKDMATEGLVEHVKSDGRWLVKLPDSPVV